VEGEREREAQGLGPRRTERRGLSLGRDMGGGFVGAVVVRGEEVGDGGVKAAGELAGEGGGQAPPRVESHDGGRRDGWHRQGMCCPSEERRSEKRVREYSARRLLTGPKCY
jgi:hypothetical protein